MPDQPDRRRAVLTVAYDEPLDLYVGGVLVATLTFLYRSGRQARIACDLPDGADVRRRSAQKRRIPDAHD